MAVKRICTINARGGSKGVPGKNLAKLGGKTLLEHSISQAFESGVFEKCAVSSDSEEILRIAKKSGAVTVERPGELAGDESPKLPSIIHCVQAAEEIFGITYDTVVDLDVTSPLRSLSDIRSAVFLLEENSLDSVFSGVESRRSPYFNMVSRTHEGAWQTVLQSNDIFRRQDAPVTYDMNASIYAWRRDALIENASVFTQKTEIYLMPPERSWDVDSVFDLEIVRYLHSKQGATK